MEMLQEFRDEIDRIDQQIVELIEERMKISEKVAEYKKETGKKVLDKEREQQKLDQVMLLAGNPFNRLGIKELYQQILSISRKLQYRMIHTDPFAFSGCSRLPVGQACKIAYFGRSGSFTEHAMEAYFGGGIQGLSAATFLEVMRLVKDQEADYGVLPIENTTTGGITDCYDLLAEFDNYIVAEHVLKIDQSLLGLADAQLKDIKRVYSHPQAILQCGRFFAERPDIQAVAVESTAYAAQKVYEENDRTQAAIAGCRASETYHLKVLEENIHDEAVNATRFIIIANQKLYLENADKVSICFTIPHASGTLYNMLSHILYNGLNMTKIESRPEPGKTFAYRFFIDFTGNFQDEAVINALNGIKAEALGLKILGNYTCGTGAASFSQIVQN